MVLTDLKKLYCDKHKLFNKLGEKPPFIERCITVFKTYNSPAELSIEISDEKDPFIALTCKIDEKDFRAMQDKQDLTSDYDSFLENVVDLLKKSKEDRSSFFLVMKDTNLSFVEKTKMKQIQHLILTLVDASNEEKKKRVLDHINVLSEMLKTSAEKNEKASRRIEELEDKITKLKQSFLAEFNKLEQQQAEKTHKIVEETTNKFNEEINTKNMIINSTINKSNGISNENATLKEHVNKLESGLAFATDKYNALLFEKKKVDSNLEIARLRIADNVQNFTFKDAEIEKMKSHIELLNKKIDVKERDNELLQETVFSQSSELNHIRFKLNDAMATVQKLSNEYARNKKDLEEARTDLIKSHEIIKKLHSEMPSPRQKAFEQEHFNQIELLKMTIKNRDSQVKKLMEQKKKADQDNKTLIIQLTQDLEKLKLCGQQKTLTISKYKERVEKLEEMLVQRKGTSVDSYLENKFVENQIKANGVQQTENSGTNLQANRPTNHYDQEAPKEARLGPARDSSDVRRVQVQTRVNNLHTAAKPSSKFHHASHVTSHDDDNIEIKFLNTVDVTKFTFKGFPIQVRNGSSEKQN